ncbi:MAG: PIN domain-containing protein [Chloroflexota bacterium]
MALAFIDTNILLRHLRGDHADHSPKATALLSRIERGELEARLSDMVIFETVFTLERSYSVPKAQIRDALLALLALPGLALQGKRRYQRIFDLYVDHNLPFGDAYIAAEMEYAEATALYSFDREFDRLPGVTRLEPGGDLPNEDG